MKQARRAPELGQQQFVPADADDVGYKRLFDSWPLAAFDRVIEVEQAEPPRPGRDAAQAVTPAAPAARAGFHQSGCSKVLIHNWCHAWRKRTALGELAASARAIDLPITLITERSVSPSGEELCLGDGEIGKFY